MLKIKKLGGFMSTAQQFPVYTGTFTTQKGEKRTMSFVKMTDLPKTLTNVFTRSRNLQPGFETVWDVDKSAYRTFNHNSVIGSIQVSYRNVTVRS